MVVSESIPGIEVEVIVGGVALKEHQDHDLEEEDRTVTRFIEATPGEIFTVRINVLPNVRFESDYIACNIYADGTWVESPLLAARDIGSPVVRGYRWLVDGRAQKCRFADLEIVSDGHIRPSEIGKAKELGTVKVVLNHKRQLRLDSILVQEPVESQELVSEKALKVRAIAHNVEFTRAQYTDRVAPTVYETTAAIGQPNPPANIVFCYRSRTALQAMGIIPRTPSPPPVQNREAATLSVEEIRDMQKRLQELTEQVESGRRVKQEREDDGPEQSAQKGPRRGDVLFEIDDDGNLLQRSTAALPAIEVVELD